VERGLRKRTDFAIGDTRDAIALLPSREAGSNVLEVTEELRATVERLHREAFLPEGLELEMVSDQTEYIYDALRQVRENLFIGAGLAMVVLLLFLQSFSSAAVVAIAIPVCVLGTALGMTMLGRSVNVVSLAGVTFAVGMVVDNSIVALENIDTWRSRVQDSRDAALFAVREVWGAILASTATTAAVFIPILTWQGEVGELLRDIAYAVAISVILSLLVAVLAIPSLAARLLSGREKSKARSLAGVTAWAGRLKTKLAAPSQPQIP
jgi:HAE1 family hydrophobic/amphiphilic exporter-1